MDYTILIGIIVILLSIIIFMLGRNSARSDTDVRLDVLETKHDDLESGIMSALKDMYIMDKLAQETLKNIMLSQEAQWKTLLQGLDVKTLPRAGDKDEEDSA